MVFYPQHFVLPERILNKREVIWGSHILLSSPLLPLCGRGTKLVV